MPKPSTDLTPALDEQAQAALLRALAEGVSLSDLLGQFGTGLVPEPTRPKPETAPELTPDQVEAAVSAVERAAKLYGAVNPSEARELTGEELVALFDERSAIDALERALAVFALRKAKTIRNTVNIHLDRRDERTGAVRPDAVGDKPATPRDENGHYLVRSQDEIPGTGKVFRRELRGGQAELDSGLLAAAEVAGAISHEDYLALTKPARVVDPDKVRAALAKNPALFAKLARHATKTAPVTGAVYVR